MTNPAQLLRNGTDLKWEAATDVYPDALIQFKIAASVGSERGQDDAIIVSTLSVVRIHISGSLLCPAGW